MENEIVSCRVTFKRAFPPGCGVEGANSKIFRNFKRDFPPGCGPNALKNCGSDNVGGMKTLRCPTTAVKSGLGPKGLDVRNLTSDNSKPTGASPGVDGVYGGLGGCNLNLNSSRPTSKVKYFDQMMKCDENMEKGKMPVLEVRSGEGEESKEREKMLVMLKLFRERCDELLKGRKVRRVDLEAYRELTNSGKIVKNSGLVLGDIPGVEVGEMFYYRVELTLVGLHRLFQGGIDSVESGYCDRYASCIVANERHLDKMGDPNMLTYVGEGGTLKRNEAGIPPDQQLVAGNLALYNSWKKKKPVRVVRGLTYGSGGTKIVYVYDGLYEVMDAVRKKGPQGNMIYEFQLVRIPGQRAIRWIEYRKMFA